MTRARARRARQHRRLQQPLQIERDVVARRRSSRTAASSHAASPSARRRSRPAIDRPARGRAARDAARRRASRLRASGCARAAPPRPAARARCRRARRGGRSGRGQGRSVRLARCARAGRASSDPSGRRRWRCGRRRPDDVALGHGVDGVVGALAVHVGQQREQRAHGRLGEDDDVVHAAQRRHELGAVGRRQDGPARALQRPHRRVVVDGDDQPVGLRRGALEIADVADVQQVEAAVGERDRAPRRAVARDRVDAARRVSESTPSVPAPVRLLRPPASFRASPRDRSSTASRSSAAETVAVPRFITTSPPA